MPARIEEVERVGRASGAVENNARVLITISRLPGIGKTTVARLVAEALGLEHVHAGDLFRRQTEAAGLSLAEYARRAETDHPIERAASSRSFRKRAADMTAYTHQLETHPR